MKIRQGRESDLAPITALIAGEQARPDRFVAYLGEDVSTIETEIRELDSWALNSTLAVRGNDVVGVLLAETDVELGRVWWWGPFAPEEAAWPDVPARLQADARSRLPVSINQEEWAGDVRHTALRSFCAGLGARADVASASLSLDAASTTLPDPAHALEPVSASECAAVAALHDTLFPGTYSTGRQLVSEPRARAFVRVIHDRDRLVGYVAVERQPDGGYIQFLGVTPEDRRKGWGRMLVTEACRALFAEGLSRVHLGVREDNTAARALYRGLGFVEERLLRPYRRGF